jgi:hypothetical protein
VKATTNGDGHFLFERHGIRVTVDGFQFDFITLRLEVYDRLPYGEEKILGTVSRSPKKVAVPSTNG